MKKLLVAVLLCAASVAAQVGTISTGGLGGPGSFGSRGFGGPAHVRPPLVFPVDPFGPCCSPAIAASFGHDPRVSVRLGGFGARHHRHAGGVLVPFGWVEEEVLVPVPVAVETPASALPRQFTSQYEPPPPASPLILELQGNRWVRCRMAGAASLRADETPCLLGNEDDQLEPAPAAKRKAGTAKKPSSRRAAQRSRSATPKS